LLELAKYLPLSLEEMSRISGFGEVKISRYGKAFLMVISEYCRERQLESRISEKNFIRRPRRLDQKERINETKSESLRMFREGKTIAEIARSRDLATQTIENHLAFFIPTGEVMVTDLVSEEKILLIREVIGKNGNIALKPIKDALGDNYSYAEIRAVIEEMKRMR
jgi:ATP-dependent DNA helicase RecQ